MRSTTPSASCSVGLTVAGEMASRIAADEHAGVDRDGALEQRHFPRASRAVHALAMGGVSHHPRGPTKWAPLPIPAIALARNAGRVERRE
jgi:hypothetical protein